MISDFCRLAVDLKMLTAEQAEQLSRHDIANTQQLGETAVEDGLLTTTQVDIVNTLLAPESAVPGYEILSLLGRGGMGVVYRARQKNLHRIVALKTVLVSQVAQAGALARFEREAQTVARLAHPNIVAAYDFGKHAGRLYLAMELVEGDDAESVIARQGRFSEGLAWGLIRQTAAGLSHALRLGVVHRDVKPANLLLVKPPEGYPLPHGLPLVKIADFGLALLTQEADTNTRLTMGGTTLGSPHYMAPEQFSGSDVDHRADIYALGASAYQMLAGRPPFSGQTLAQIISQKVQGLLPPLESMAPATCDLVRHMLAEDPRQRVQDYDQLMDAIDRLPPMSIGIALTAGSERKIEAGSTNRFPTTSRTTSLPPSSAVSADLPTAAMPTSSSPQPVSSASRKRGRRVLIVAGVAAAVVASAVILWQTLPTGGATTTVTPVETSVVWEDQLFDGRSLDRWRPSPGGSWSLAVNDDNAPVLEGVGMVQRALTRPPDGRLVDYRVLLNVDLRDAQSAELQFAFQSTTPDDPPRYVLRLTSDKASLGTQKSEGQPLAFSLERSLAEIGARSGKYHELRADRVGGNWLAFVDGKLLGALAVSQQPELPEIRLQVVGGPAQFDSIALNQLRAKK